MVKSIPVCRYNIPWCLSSLYRVVSVFGWFPVCGFQALRFLILICFLSRKSQAREQVASGSESRAAYWTRQLSRGKRKMKENFQTIQPWAWTLKKIGGVLGFEGRGLGPGLLGSEARAWFPGSDRGRGGDSCTTGLRDEG